MKNVKGITASTDEEAQSVDLAINYDDGSTLYCTFYAEGIEAVEVAPQTPDGTMSDIVGMAYEPAVREIVRALRQALGNK